MSKMETDELDEKPLDPEVEKVRRKMVRLLAVSIGIMIIGVMAVLAAVVYRVSQSEGERARYGGEETFAVPADAPIAAEAALPDGFIVEDVALDGTNVLFFGMSADGLARAYVFDIATSRIIADVTVGE